MEIQSVCSLCFSPTGTTRIITENIVQGISPEHVEMVDITKRSARNTHPLSGKEDLVIISTPVYYGRIPEEIVPYLIALKAEQTPVILVAVYGNRAFDDALKELYDITEKCNFIPIAGAAFIAEHSYSSKSYPIAQGRPDVGDIQKAKAFGVSIRKKLQSVVSLKQLSTFTIPGQFPYIEPVSLNMIKEARAAVPLTPETDTSKCTQCGVCAEVCPNGAIAADDATQTDRWKCLICFACVKNCPEEARAMNEPNFQSAIQTLQQNCQGRKEPELYL